MSGLGSVQNYANVKKLQKTYNTSKTSRGND